MKTKPFARATTWRKFACVLAMTVLALTTAAMPAAAQYMQSASADAENGVPCTGYSIYVTAYNLAIGNQYTISWQINGLPQTVNDSVTFTATGIGFSHTITKTWASYGITPTGSYSLTGTATLVGYNTIPIRINQNLANFNCPGQCSAQTTNNSNFNGTTIDSGTYIWFNANLKASGIPSTGATVLFQESSIQFTANGNYNLLVPNAQITFSPSAACTSSTFDTATNTWQTIVPVTGDDEIFLTGLTFPVPSGFSQVQGNVTWQGTMSSNVDGVSIQWKWGAAVYTTFSANYNTLAVKPGHQTSCSYHNGDHAGTPEGIDPVSGEPFKKFVIGGARGGGGSNWTGSWSSTVSTQCQ